ncbi:MAG: cob(I)yrinic acid a,c-diamide adenosyltransferase [Rhodospirillales bacterium]|nr:cob(I)yrinic acid a,c-diamide adenosyltransferase [Rhodospirillales bacterium]
MVKLDKIYTTGGDLGETSLSDGSRVTKHEIRIAAFGTVDEANAHIGVARLLTTEDVDAILERLQNDLFDLGADLARPAAGQEQENDLRIVQNQIDRLEQEIDEMNDILAPLTSFVLPGGCACAAHLHVARTVIRRAERLVSELAQETEINQLSLIYLNRLSDHLFILARHLNDNGAADVLWEPGKNH